VKLKTLEEYPNLAERIRLKREMIEVLESARESTTHIIAVAPGGRRANRDRLLGYAEKLSMWAQSLAEEVLAHVEVMREVDQWLAGLSGDERAVIRAKFIDRKDGRHVTWTEAATRAHCSESQPYKVMKRLAERGLLEL
jgi:DNA-directed RNA polymerase sigma subunit (sigma70/sigma32)